MRREEKLPQERMREGGTERMAKGRNERKKAGSGAGNGQTRKSACAGDGTIGHHPFRDRCPKGREKVIGEGR